MIVAYSEGRPRIRVRRGPLVTRNGYQHVWTKPNRAPAMDAYTKADLQSYLEALGVEAGDMLFIHSSFKSLGPVAGGAQTVVDALQAAVGSDGLILMPSFHLIERSERARRWDWADYSFDCGGG